MSAEARREAQGRARRLPEDLPANLETPAERALGDFTMTFETVRIIPLALLIGALATVVAVILLDLIGLVTNLLYRGTIDTTLLPPDPWRLGPISILIPVAGGLVIGLMARFGSERIRGHGIPEAMETILVGGSKVEPRLAILKPISSAISIGTGGPFGAEGPIILTGGAVGSVLSQLFHLSAAERKTLLVSGAAAGMTAVFATPVASVLLATELLLFEWKPRSLVPVAAASALAAALRLELAQGGVLAQAPLFPVPEHSVVGAPILLGALLIGTIGGVVAWISTGAVYGAEDGFARLPIHWMWWPAIGGLVVGIGGLIEPAALGVGYESIRALLAGELAVTAVVSLLVVKLVIWSVALGSGTSGGILAPLLIIGGATGALVGHLLPAADPSIWALLGMSAVLAGVTRSPLMSMVFAIELTHDQDSLLPLLIACVTAHAISVLILRRSILTEKVARRGFHVSREYAVDPLEALLVRDVMVTNLLTVEPTTPVGEVATIVDGGRDRRQRLYPVVDEVGGLLGVIGARELASGLAAGKPGALIRDLMRHAVVAHPDETLRSASDRMATARLGVLPVVDREGDRLLGLISRSDLLRARDLILTEERHRERVMRPRLLPRLRHPRASLGD